MSPELSIVMPAFNEAQNLERNVPRLVERLEDLEVAFELIIVNDGSADTTADVAETLGRQDSRIVVRHHARNHGIGAGLMSGVRAARGEFLMVIPADLAFDLGDLEKYVRADRSIDVLVGRRSDRRDYSAARKLVSVANIWLIRMLFGVRQRQFNYISRYRTEVLRNLAITYTGSALIFAEIIIKAHDLGLSIQEVEITYVPREYGKQTGASLRLIGRTGRDMLHFWVTRAIRGKLQAPTRAVDL